MQTQVLYSPAYATAKLTLAAGETVRAESGAMLAMSPGISMETSTQGGVLKGLKRAVLGGESFFMNTFTAQVDGAEMYVAPSLPGDVVAWPLNGQLFVTSGSYLASSAGVEVDTQWGGGKTFFSSEGLFMLRVAGQGEIVLSSEQYSSEAAAYNGAFAVQAEAKNAAAYEVKQNTGGGFYFTVKAPNGEIIGVSQQYSSKASAEGGIASLQSFLPTVTLPLTLG